MHTASQGRSPEPPVPASLACGPGVPFLQSLPEIILRSSGHRGICARMHTTRPRKQDNMQGDWVQSTVLVGPGCRGTGEAQAPWRGHVHSWIGWGRHIFPKEVLEKMPRTCPADINPVPLKSEEVGGGRGRRKEEKGVREREEGEGGGGRGNRGRRKMEREDSSPLGCVTH